MSGMLAPPVGGATSGGRWIASVVSHQPGHALAIGTTLGGALLGAVLVALHTLTSVAPMIRVAIILALAVASVFALVRRRWSGIRFGFPRQVPSEWLHWSDRRRTALAWGALLGSGVATHPTTMAFPLLIGLILIQPFAWIPLWAGIAYGAARGTALVIAMVLDPDISPVRRRQPGSEVLAGHRTAVISGRVLASLALLLTVSILSSIV